MISKVKKLFSLAASVISQERPNIFIFQLVKWALYVAEGRIFAFLVGWGRSYLGRGSRVIGTKSIFLIETVSIGRYAWIEAVGRNNGKEFSPKITIGRRFSASERLHIASVDRVEIGDDCLFGSGVYISDHNHGVYKGSNQSHPKEPPIKRNLVSNGGVFIGSNVWIGDNVVLVGTLRIGCGVVIGANSVVVRDVPDNVLIAGSPARIIKKFDSLSESWGFID